MTAEAGGDAHTRGADFQRVRRSTLLAYGLSGLPLNFFGTFLGVHLIIFYTDTAGLDSRWIAIGMLVATLWDAVSDPLMGVISDHTKWAWGRRRPYVALGAVPLGASFFLLLAPPASLEGVGLGVYFTVVMVLLYTCRTVVETPIMSLAPEIAQAYHERTRLGAYRESFGNLGDLCALLVPILLTMVFVGALEGEAAATATRRAFRTTGVLAAGVGLAGFFVTYRGTYEDPTFRRELHIDYRSAVRAVLRNRAFLILLVSATLAGMGLTMVMAMILYVMRYLVGINDPLVEIACFTVNIGGALGSYPFWVWLAKRYGKPAAFRLGLFTSSLTFVSVFLLRPGDLYWLYALMAFGGAANVGVWMLLFTLSADIIDIDELETGLRREGMYAGFSTLIRKTAIALGTGAVALGLDVIGYQPNMEQTPETQMGMRLLFAIPTTVLVLAAYVLFRRFPLTRDAHGALMAQVHRRRVALGVAHDDEAALTDPEAREPAP